MSTTDNRDHYLSTFYVEGTRKPIQHVYGPFTRAQAQRERRRMLADAKTRRPQGVVHIAVCKPIDPSTLNEEQTS